MLLAAAVASTGFLAHAATAKPPGSFVDAFHKIKTVASTVPSNGDVNPYGVAIAPVTRGHLVKGDVLISNFNDKKNLQGTGRTIVEVSPAGKVTQFASLKPGKLHGACPGGVGLTTALVVLKSGWVVVGSLPTKDGTSATAKAGCLIVLNSAGKAVKTISGGPVNGPWDMTALDHGASADLFVTSVLNGTVAASPKTVDRGTVVRIDLGSLNGASPKVGSETVIGGGFPERTDPAAMLVGPTGLGLATDGMLYVADSAGNRVTAIADAAKAGSAADMGKTVTSGGSLNDPLGLAIAPGGDILTANGDDGKLVETTPAGTQASVKVIDNTKVKGEPNGNGTLFGLGVEPHAAGVYYVDDGTNSLNLLH